MDAFVLEEVGLADSEERLQDDELLGENVWAYLVAMTICLGGLQVAFSIQFVAGTDYLSALDLSTAQIGLVWLLPPLCGALLQPYFGYCSDRHSSTLGKRKPFIMGGGIALMISLLSFAWTAELSKEVAGLAGYDSCLAASPVCMPAKLLAVLSILGINVSAQAVQAGARAQIVDQCPHHLQSQTNAWAARMCNVASMLVYFASFLDMSNWISVTGETQTKGLSLLGCFVLLVTLTITCVGVKNPVNTILPIEGRVQNSVGPVKQVLLSLRSAPKQIHQIYIVQFFSWFAWYPFLVYITNYVGTLDIRARNEDRSTIGGLALLGLSFGALLTSCTVPTVLSQSRHHTRHLHWSMYRNLWFVSQIGFSLGLFGIVWSESCAWIVLLASLIGFSWAVTQWVPFTLANVTIQGIDFVDGNRDQTADGAAGTLTGIHNFSIAAPQILASLLCSFTFRLVRSDGGNEAAVKGMLLIFSGCGAVSLVAALLVLRLAKSSVD